MITCTVAFLLSLLVAAVLTPVIRGLAIRRGWVDPAASSRKIHKKPIPRLGGVAIVLAFFAPLVGLLVTTSEVGSLFLANPKYVVGIFVGGIGIALVGLFDDFVGLGAGKKFSAQFLIAALMYSLGFAIQEISTHWGALPLGAFSVLFTMVWIVGVINAMNLIDGLDGLASGVALFAVATNFVLAFSRGQPLMMLFMAALGGAILGFLVYNFNPASIFMGDTGSMFLGFVLATSSIITSQKSGATVAMLVPILALGLPIMDTLLAMLRRAMRGLPLFSADKEHIHHKLLAMGLSHRKAVLVLYGICAMFGAVALLLTWANGPQTALLLCVTVIIVFILVRQLGYASLASPQVQEDRKRNLEIRERVREIGEALQHAAVPSAAWDAVQPLGEAMGLAEVTLSMSSLGKTGARESSDFSWRLSDGNGEKLVVALELASNGANLGKLQVAWQDGRTSIDRDDEIALELLRDHLASAARRMGRKPTPANVIKIRRGA